MTSEAVNRELWWPSFSDGFGGGLREWQILKAANIRELIVFGIRKNGISPVHTKE